MTNEALRRLATEANRSGHYTPLQKVVTPDVVLALLDELHTAHMDGYEGGKQEARDAAHAEIERKDALLREALRALKHHTDQTRPIECTFDTMDRIKEELK